MREWLAESFRYDLWANRVWAEALEPVGDLHELELPPPMPDFPQGDPAARARAVFRHLLRAERVWLDRCGGRVEPAPPDAAGWAQALTDAWIALVERRDLGERIDYVNGAGEALHMTFGEIVAHVLRHGAYHRGQMREIFEAIRPDDIPQT